MAVFELDQHTRLIQDLMDEARRQGTYVIARLQRVESRSLNVANGVTESVAATLSQGIGLQVFDRDGFTAFASTDRIEAGPAMQALRSALAGLRAASQAGLEHNPAIYDVEPEQARIVGPAPYSLDHLTLHELQEHVVAVNREVMAFGTDLKVRTPFAINREEWRIVRSDGTDVHFILPHGYCYNSVTAQRDGEAHTVAASLSRTGYEILLDEPERSALLRRAQRAAEQAQRLAGAPRYPAGSYPIVMDYAMAKGLAHEAFGHAAETDGLRTSILGSGGRFRHGEVMAAETVSIVDEPIPGDHAYQPFSSNGVRRGRATILDHGLLQDALADVFSAKSADVRVIDAARAQSYGSVPMPRMTNIRIELPDALPMSGRFEEQTPEDVRSALLNAGLLTADRPVVYLSGYTGGQVSRAQGDFVFNCAALYEISVEGIKLYQPGIFSGQTLAALHAIRAGFGPLQLDAMGWCGKAGQTVPSSGGSHYFLYLEANPQVMVGGQVQTP
jgi:TldD protein